MILITKTLTELCDRSICHLIQIDFRDTLGLSHQETNGRIVTRGRVKPVYKEPKPLSLRRIFHDSRGPIPYSFWTLSQAAGGSFK